MNSESPSLCVVGSISVSCPKISHSWLGVLLPWTKFYDFSNCPCVEEMP